MEGQLAFWKRLTIGHSERTAEFSKTVRSKARMREVAIALEAHLWLIGHDIDRQLERLDSHAFFVQ